VRNPLFDLVFIAGDLHRQELNGRWARIIKTLSPQSFSSPTLQTMSLASSLGHWENLPDEYRRSTMNIVGALRPFSKKRKGI